MARTSQAPAAPKVNECCACGCVLGAEAKVVPFSVTDDGKTDRFCPQCFVHVRARLDVARFDPRGFAAVACCSPTCGLTNVTMSKNPWTKKPVCGQCRANEVIVLGPKVSVA
jgi:hypothetical protein